MANYKNCPKDTDIIKNGGQVIKNPDGTISVFVSKSKAGGTGFIIPYNLDKYCCERLSQTENYFFDEKQQKCRWASPDINDCNYNAPFNLVLNPDGNDGAIFSKDIEETCTLSIDFDYLFKFDCDTLTKLVNGTTKSDCEDIISVFESIGASAVLETLEVINGNIVVTNTYQQTFFSTIGANNLYNYLTNKGADTGFYVCGGLSKNTNDTTCYPLNLYNLNIGNDTLNCTTAVNQILTGLVSQANSSQQLVATNVSASAFSSNWLHYHVEITDENIINSIAGKKIRLSIQLSGSCINSCVLLDNIRMDKNCTKVIKRDIFVTKNPGFQLDRIIDNKKSWIANTETTHRTFNIAKSDGTQPIRYTDYYLENERQVINSKEIDLDIDIAAAVETDVWCYISDNPCILTGNTIGTTTCIKNVGHYVEYRNSSGVVTGSTSICIPKTYCCSDYCGDANININGLMTEPLSAVTTIEDFEYYITSELIDAKDRKTITSYATLRMLYDRYMNSLNFCSTESAKFDYYKMDDFAKLIGNYWVDLIEQVIPATTIWGATKIYTNTIFDNQKFKYKSYSSFFGYNKYKSVKVLSPVSGDSCNASVTTTFINGASTGTTLFYNEGDVHEYNNIFPIQMNSGSEFVSLINFKDGGNIINECLLSVKINNNVDKDGTMTAIPVNAFGAVSYYWSPIGLTTQSIPVNNLSGGTYTVTVTDEICEASASFNVTWLTNETACETDSFFTIRKNITGLASPAGLLYDSTANRVYVADISVQLPKRNIYWFNPLTATSESDMTYYTGIPASNSAYWVYTDTLYKKIYLTGSQNINGLNVYDIATNTSYEVAYGSASAFRRQILLVVPNYIYALDTTISASYPSFKKFDRPNVSGGTTTTIIVSGATEIPYLSSNGVANASGANLLEVENYIWVTPGSGNLAGDIGIFDTSFNLVNTITIPTKGIFLNGNYWGVGFYDKQFKKFHYFDFQGNTKYVISVNPSGSNGTIDYSVNYSTIVETGSYALVNSWAIDPVSNKLYENIGINSSPSVYTGIKKTYTLNRTTGQREGFILDYILQGIYQVNDGLQNSLMGPDTGRVAWGSPNTGFNSDGKITFFNNTVSGDTTGVVDVLTLNQYINNIATNNTKNNVFGQPDYIAQYSSVTLCSPVYKYTCPAITQTKDITNSIVYYEFSIQDNVKLNPNITQIKASVIDAGVFTGSTNYNPPFVNYFTGSTIVPSTSPNYEIKVEYFSGLTPTLITGCTCTSLTGCTG